MTLTLNLTEDEIEMLKEALETYVDCYATAVKSANDDELLAFQQDLERVEAFQQTILNQLS